MGKELNCKEFVNVLLSNLLTMHSAKTKLIVVPGAALCSINLVVLLILGLTIHVHAEVILVTGADDYKTPCGDAITTEAQLRLYDLVGLDERKFGDLTTRFRKGDKHVQSDEEIKNYLYNVASLASTDSWPEIINDIGWSCYDIYCVGADAIYILVNQIPDGQQYITARWKAARGDEKVYAARVNMEAMKINNEPDDQEILESFYNSKKLMMERCIREDQPRDYYYLTWAAKPYWNAPILDLQEIADSHDWFVAACIDDDPYLSSHAGSLISDYLIFQFNSDGAIQSALDSKKIHELKEALKTQLKHQQDWYNAALLALRGVLSKEEVLEFERFVPPASDLTVYDTEIFKQALNTVEAR